MQGATGSQATVDDAEQWASTNGLDYPVLADIDRAWEDVYIKSGENFATYLINRDGTVAWREFGEELSTYDRAEEQVLALL